MANHKQSSSVTCFRCGECCRRYQVLLNPAEIDHIAKHLGLSLEDFRARYADPRWPDTDKCLVQQSSGACPFLRGQDREFLCAIHAEKTAACRNWAADLSKPECRKGLNEYWQITIDDAGDLCGAPSDIQAFLSYLKTCTE